MRFAKAHPVQGWLRLQARDYNTSLDRLLLERDRDADLTRSGPAPGYIDWMWGTELPRLARDPYYRDQITQHLTDLAQRSAAIAAEINSLVGSKLDEQAAADELREQLSALLDE